jgi:acyl-CoA thioesterase I
VDRRFLFLPLAFILLACSQPAHETREPAETPAPAARVQKPASPANSADSDKRQVIAAFGDSLTAGYGLDPGLSYPDFLQKALDKQGYRYRVVNLGISGDTSGGGVARIDSATALHPAIAILELGANDGLRGLPVATTRANLEEIILGFQKSGARIVLAGITLPPNYGPDYIRQFEGVYSGLAAKYKLTLIPFLLDGVATVPGLMQGDRLHPTAQGNEKVAATVLHFLTPMLER